jgi:hypothetical protein
VAAPSQSITAPKFLKTIQPVTHASAGQLIRLDAKISGSPPIDVKWYRDGIEVQPDMTHKLIQENDVHTLLILESNPSDRGVYDCIAVNATGEARCRTSVDIKATAGYRRPLMSSLSQMVPSQIQEPSQRLTAHEEKQTYVPTRTWEAKGEFETM